MLEALWFALSHPSMIVGRDGGGTMILLTAVVAGLTVGFMATIQRLVLPGRPLLASLIGCAFVPLLMNALSFLVARDQPPGSDAGGMLAVMTFVLSICVIPVTLATSVLYVVARLKSFSR